jgi:hypothetical protein
VALAANGTSDVVIEPPDANEEWELLLVVVVDGNSIDAADLVNFYYEDAVLNVGIPLNTQTAPALVNGIGLAAAFPSNTAEVNRGYDLRPRVFRAANGESRNRVKTRWRASGTVGSRGLTRRGLYLRRNI